MNYYFLLEDSQSFFKVLPIWLEYMGFPCTRVADIDEVKSNNYVMQSGHGVTQLITKALYATMDTMIEKPGRIDHLVIILDAEERTVEERKAEVNQKIEEYKQKYNCTFDFQIKILVCNHCFESWLLGNQNIYPSCEPSSDSDFYPYYKHYNIKENDPEIMSVPESVQETTATYHFHYLHEALRHNKIRYSKKRPQNVCTWEYFQTILFRMNTTSHINTFRELWEYIQEQST